MKKYQLKRRVFLKGAGSVVVGLPLLEESLSSKAWAQNGSIPKRCLTMSFGLGVEKALQDEGWNGPLAPLKNIAPKAAFFSNLKNSHLKGGGTVHFEVGATQFTGLKQNRTRQAGGPSLEQIFRLHYHPNGVPTVTGLPSKSAGMWSRTGAVPQYMRHWNSDGGPGERPERRPSKVFDSIFGKYKTDNGGNNNNTPNPELELEKRIRRSVLDTVVDQYKSLTGNASYLGKESKDRINSHLETIRSIEKDLLEGDLADEQITSGEVAAGLIPNKADYTDPAGISFYDKASGPTTGPKTEWQAAQKAFRLSGQLIALGMSMDALRFASMIFVGSGEHLRFSGEYNATAIGKSLNFSQVFNSRSPHDGIFHNYVQNSVRVYQYYTISQLAYVMEEMDKIMEPNGMTLLDNCLTVIGTEYGKNHNGGSDIFHGVIGGNGLFKPGRYTSNWGFNDVYKTVLDAYRIDHKIGGTTIGEILA